MLGRSLEVPLCKGVKHHLRFALDLLNGVKTATLKLERHLGEEEEAAGGQIRLVGWVGSNDCVGGAQKLSFFYAM